MESVALSLDIATFWLDVLNPVMLELLYSACTILFFGGPQIKPPWVAAITSSFDSNFGRASYFSNFETKKKPYGAKSVILKKHFFFVKWALSFSR